ASAFDPPVQHKDERRHDVFGCEVPRYCAPIGSLECLSNLIPDALGQHSVKMLMNDASSPSAHFRLGSMTTLPDVFEHWKAEPQGSGETTDARWQCARRCRLQHLLDAAGQQRILVREMRIKG